MATVMPERLQIFMLTDLKMTKESYFIKSAWVLEAKYS